MGFIAHIGGMDCLARGLRGAAKLMQEGAQKAIISQRYQTWDENPLAKKVQEGQATLEEIEEYAKRLPAPGPSQLAASKNSWSSSSTGIFEVHLVVFCVSDDDTCRECYPWI